MMINVNFRQEVLLNIQKLNDDSDRTFSHCTVFSPAILNKVKFQIEETITVL